MCPQKLMKIVLNMLSIDLFLKFDRGMDKCEKCFRNGIAFHSPCFDPPRFLALGLGNSV